MKNKWFSIDLVLRMICIYPAIERLELDINAATDA